MNAQSKITATVRAFLTAKDKANESIRTAGEKLVISILLAVWSGYAVDENAMDVAGVIGGKGSPTAPLRSAIIGKSGIVALIREAGAVPSEEESYDSERFAMEHPTALAVMASYVAKNATVTDVRISLGLPVEDNTRKTRKTAQEETPELTAREQAMQVLSVSELTREDLLAVLSETMDALEAHRSTVATRARAAGTASRLAEWAGVSVTV